ncbi:GNAT family N-acetyltransferase [Lentzea sp. NPDC059081]|uniref:GNAT family N-acetyltransferase n=1 Tax=Lentzea sp. NPDC059081 TaxID=3346719 RepID=UPI0036B5698C
MFRYEVVCREPDGRYEVLARAVDVDGLFEDPVAAPRERLVLRGCSAAPELLTGDLRLDVVGSAGRQWWMLSDVVVHAVLPGGDVIASASANQLLDDVDLGPSRPGYLLRKDGDELGVCSAVEGFPRAYEHVWPPVTLIGCDTPYRIRPVEGALRALDLDGRVVDHAGVALDVASMVPSAVGEGLFDVVLDQSRYGEGPDLAQRPVPAARAVWRRWQDGVPAERNLWAPLSPESRMWWNEIALKAPRARPTAGVHEVDGRYATDEFGLHLALCEALVGPGHSLGSPYTITGVYDEWWFVPGITLVWQDAHVAHEAMPGHFAGLLKYLRRNGVEVRLSAPGLEDRLDRCVEIGALVDRWVAGWAKAEELQPDLLLDNWHVWAEPPGPAEEERILAGDANAAAHAEDVALSHGPMWLTVPTDFPDEVTEVVREAGLTVHEQRTFLRRTLDDHLARAFPDGYEISVDRSDVIEVRVFHDGEEVAGGKIAVIGSDAVPHAVETVPEHRRRGLGSAVMGVLAREAVAAGAVDGLLVATAEGLHLYRALGWRTISDVVTASNTEGEA